MCLWPMSADLEHISTKQMTLLMQATVVKAVLPLWSHPQLSKCSFRITRHVITILTDCSAGTSSASAVLNRASTVIRPNAAPDPAMVQNIVDMGFSRARVEETLRRVCCQHFWSRCSCSCFTDREDQLDCLTEKKAKTALRQAICRRVARCNVAPCSEHAVQHELMCRTIDIYKSNLATSTTLLHACAMPSCTLQLHMVWMCCMLQINYSSAELAVEWLMAHPEDPAAASSTAADASAKDADEDAIKKQVMDVLGPDETPPEKLEVWLHLLC